MKTKRNPGPDYKYNCEAREPGRPSHTFPTVDAYTARCVCDANGWEFIRVYAIGGDSDRPAAQPPKGDRPFSHNQRISIISEARRTYDILREADVVDISFDDWRHDQVWLCVRRKGLTHCVSSHYKPLLNHFRRLRGAPHQGGPSGKQSREGGDTADRRAQVIALIARELGSHAGRVENPQTDQDILISARVHEKGGVIGDEYLMHIARGKNPGHTLTDPDSLICLPASRLEHLLFTIRNRIAAREGRGSAGNRNKGREG